MSIVLYEHNQKAYEAAISMMEETGKAAIIHPTGTGKSFIGFKLAEEHPDNKICWFSPSEYIFNTQIENLKNTGNNDINNIEFITYSKLMLSDDTFIEEQKPDFIILDEFHRCGATEWGKGVARLLTSHPNAKVLGLTASHIRYLDNMRNMSDELFDGNVASEMTLGDAIVQNILPAPTYVISVYAYQRELEKYAERVDRIKNASLRKKAKEQIEALRRSLENAEGLDVIFQKHIQDKTGKFIVFCSSIEHMKELLTKVSEWFSGVDKDPHVYSTHSYNPEASSEFREFKSDTSEHLKLLFCIDMLNEGIHIDDISGVLLMRPTVSPIIYKQQLGRALSANKTKKPIIFDIVNNFDNLASITDVQKEMDSVIVNYREQGESEQIIVNTSFTIIDETLDCREIFERVQKSLSSSWEENYFAARAYFKEHGDLNVPKYYITEDNFSLGVWISTQRRVRAGSVPGILTDLQIKKLDEIGMIWDNRLEINWDRGFQYAKSYFEKNGNLDVKAAYITEDGFRLGFWITNLRQTRQSQKSILTEIRIKSLDEIGMIWNKFDYQWDKNYAIAAKYYVENGNLNVPFDYVDSEGVHLGAWLNYLRRAKQGKNRSATLTEEQIGRLDAIGMDWNSAFETLWENNFEAARKYFVSFGNLDVPDTYITDDGLALGRWIYRQRVSSKLSIQQKERLNEIGMIWKIENSWETRFSLAKDFFEKNGHLNVSASYVANGIWLGKWLYEQKRIYRGEINGKTLTLEQVLQLESIGIDWLTPTERIWESQYQNAQKYFDTYNNLEIPRSYKAEDGKLVGMWIAKQRTAYHKGSLSNEQIRRLSSIGMIWDIEDSWETNFSLLIEYIKENGDPNIPVSYITPDGIKLGCWLANQRSKYNGTAKYGTLSDRQIKRLEELGIDLSGVETWLQNFEKAESYYKKYGSIDLPNPFRIENGFDLGYWLYCQRKAFKVGKLNTNQIEKLNSIQMIWLSPAERKWKQYFEALKLYKQQYGNLSVPVTYRTEDGLWLGRWIKKQRQNYLYAKISIEQAEKLDSLDIDWFVSNGNLNDVEALNSKVMR